MNALDYTDRFIGNLIASWLIAFGIVIGVDQYSMEATWLRGATPRVEIVIACVVAVCVLFVGPAVVKFVCRIRPSIFEDKESRKAAWRGRLVGMGIGLIVGIFIQGM
ncbi:hypothetical protein [Burkholderia pyrrocinia]|uniref:hypothetical protein n=1 Tax=Burkholderia pyrrocinia TaxID=60550 RepID=UPI001BD1BC5C|nr:hypothetical protein [Burkholderia pyrrocinia]QVN21298.1 hypothetical protein JYG32_32790 [Burkholderia pyrrocinia]